MSPLLIDLQRRREKPSDKSSRRASKRVLAGLDTVAADASPWAQIVWLTTLIGAADLLGDLALMRLWRQSLVGVIPNRLATPAPSDDGEFADDRQLVLCGELPWLSGLAFANVKGASRVRRGGRSFVRSQLEAATDSDGTPHARSLHRLSLMLAVFTRSLAVGQSQGEKLFDKSTLDRFRQLIARTALMAQADGRLPLSNGESFATGSLLRTAAALAGLAPDRSVGRRLAGLPDDAPSFAGGKRTSGRRLPKIKHHRSDTTKSSPSTQSDWAELTCMRNNWSDGGDACVIAHHGVFPQVSVTGFERLLIDGDWRLAVDIDGTPIELTAGWECVCWFSDADADYVEIQQEAAGGVTLMRQALLSRTDHWLWLADNAKVQSHTAADATMIRLQSQLTIADTTKTKDNRWSRDLTLQTQKLRWHAYPLGLEQDRVQKAAGSLAIEAGTLVLKQTSTGGGLHMPLLLDWSPTRQRDAATWKQLTVAEDGVRLPARTAGGQRLRIGKHQWLFYRSHEPGQTGRSVLGHHTPHETVVAEFTTSGDVEPIVLVE